MSTFWVFVNFLEDYNRYKAENFGINKTFDDLSKNISHFVVVENFVISTCLKYVDIVIVFLRNRVLRLRQKYTLANFLILLFLAHPSEHSWQISPSIYSAFSSIKTWTVPSIASWQSTTNDWGYVLSSEPQTLRHCLNFIDVILQIPICYRRRKRKENTNIKIHVQVHFTIAVQLYVYVNVEFYIHVSLHSCLFQLWFLCGGK